MLHAWKYYETYNGDLWRPLQKTKSMHAASERQYIAAGGEVQVTKGGVLVKFYLN